MNSLPILPVSLLATLLLSLGGLADSVRLLTGDANNELHRSSSDLRDISADGDFVLFTLAPPVSGSTPGITVGGLYLRQISAGTLTFVGDNSVSFAGVGEATLSNDGRYLAWRSTTGNHIYWRDRQAGVTRHITAGADSQSREPKISGDGRYVAFISAARNLIADVSKLPASGRAAIYVYDSQTQAITIASLAPDGSALTGIGTASFAGNAYDFSDDGRFVIYSTDSPNAHPDRASMSAANPCICRRDLSTGEVLLLNRNAAGVVADGAFGNPRISATGKRASFTGAFVGIFQPGATMISSLPTYFGADLYVKDIDTGEVWHATKTNNGANLGGSFGTDYAISDDGATVSFASSAGNLVADSDPPGGGGGSMDIFRTNLAAGGAVTVSLITRSFADPGNVGYRSGPYMPGNASYVAFTSDQSDQLIGQPLATAFAYQGFGVGDLPSSGGGGFANWPDLAALPADQRGPNARPANDGVDNLVKFALGIPPLQSATARLPSEVVRGQGDDEGFPVVSYIRLKNLTGLTLQVEVCADLDFAEIIGTTHLGTEDLGDGTERVTVRSNATFASRTTQFFRLKVTED